VAARAIAIISDTHLPRGNRRLPADCVSRLRAADLIIHAGDLTAASMLEQLRGIGEGRTAPFTARACTKRIPASDLVVPVDRAKGQ
jgi:predicted phosphodiesterase